MANNRKITALQHLLSEAGRGIHNQQTDDLVPDVRYSSKQKQQTTPDEVERPRNQAGLYKRRTLSSGSSLIKRQERAGISFSVYLDHDLDLGKHQTVKFNQVIINDGNGYNTHTGVFTCPEEGVYMFSFFIGQRSETNSGFETSAELVVNSQNIIDAIVESFHPYQDLQGGNTAIKRLKQGDVVWVGLLAGHHIEGDGVLRISSFSGVYLYP